jgi:TonB family protein
MTVDRWLLSSFTASSLIHLALISLAALMIHTRPAKPIKVPIELIEISPIEQPKIQVTPAPPPIPLPRTKPEPQEISAPKLTSKPKIIETRPAPVPGKTLEDIKQPEPMVESPPPSPASLPANSGSSEGDWNAGRSPGQAEGGAAGAGDLFDNGDAGVVGGTGIEGGGGGEGISGLGQGTKGDGAGGGGLNSGEALSGIARPLGGYQVKPRYPASARRAGAQGVTRLRVHVLESGHVGEVMVDQSAGFRDLDLAAMDAVKKWRFEPARRGKEPVSVWVMLPVKFELN